MTQRTDRSPAYAAHVDGLGVHLMMAPTRNAVLSTKPAQLAFLTREQYAASRPSR